MAPLGGKYAVAARAPNGSIESRDRTQFDASSQLLQIRIAKVLFDLIGWIDNRIVKSTKQGKKLYFQAYISHLTVTSFIYVLDTPYQ